MEHRLVLSHAQWEMMRSYVESQAPLETCGLLGGCDSVVNVVITIKNAAASPFRFRMDPLEQLNAFEQIEASGQEILAIFHSHPKGPAVPSPSDIAEAAYAVIQVIWSPMEGEWLAHAFWIEAGRAAGVPLVLTDV